MINPKAVVVVLLLAAPEIISPPQNSNALQGTDATLSCNATAEPTHNVTWLKNSVAISIGTNSTKLSISTSIHRRSLASILTIRNVSMPDTAIYTCSVTNIHGNQSASAHLEVQGMLEACQ